jgi:hypothetical protein
MVQVIEDQVLPGLKLLVAESGGNQVELSFRVMVQSMMQDMRNNIGAPAKENTSTPTPKNNNFSNSTGNLGQLTPSNNSNTNNNNPNNTTNNTTTNTNNTSSNTSLGNNNNNNTEKNTPKKNLFEKLDTSSMTSIASSLKADFDKAIPKWAWKK